jgi:putative DNA methylase
MNMALKDKGAFPWALEQVIDAYKGLCNLLELSRPLFRASPSPSGRGTGGERKVVIVSQANAGSLSDFPDGSVDAVIVDPPYGNNVMYAELSDFFYVWLKRSVGDLYPDWFRSELTDKHTEAVANPARFRGVKGRDAREQATRDYMLKMRRAFREMRRVVKPEGAMVVMFTHREADMWNALGLALLETGWELGASWPVHTESEHSLHQARKNAARSTILLFCRPRPESSIPSYCDQELRQQVRATARRSALEYQKAGIEGVDLFWQLTARCWESCPVAGPSSAPR